jgi:gamma-glutamyltranspeptidase/glutathione hydrolase
MRLPARVSALFAVLLVTALTDQTTFAARGIATRSVVYARHGMVCAAQPLAVQAGLEILKEGGSAVDAAIAVNACLGLMEPTSNGLGGDMFAMVWDPKTKHLAGLNASGRAPLALTIDKVKPEKDGTIPLYSPYSWTVPGVCDGRTYAKYGKLPMSKIRHLRSATPKKAFRCRP